MTDFNFKRIKEILNWLGDSGYIYIEAKDNYNLVVRRIPQIKGGDVDEFNERKI